eukprot:6474201-Amphidinium_carterae.3
MGCAASQGHAAADSARGAKRTRFRLRGGFVVTVQAVFVTSVGSQAMLPELTAHAGRRAGIAFCNGALAAALLAGITGILFARSLAAVSSASDPLLGLRNTACGKILRSNASVEAL